LVPRLDGRASGTLVAAGLQLQRLDELARLFDGRPLSFWMIQMVAGEQEDRVEAARIVVRLLLGMPRHGRADTVNAYEKIEESAADEIRKRSMGGESVAIEAMVAPYLLVALEDPVEDVVVHSLRALQYIGPGAYWAGPRVERTIRDRPSSRVRLNAAVALYYMIGRTDLVRESLVASMSDADSEHALLAIKAVSASAGLARWLLQDLKRVAAQASDESVRALAASEVREIEGR